jgi:hypothetical protein
MFDKLTTSEATPEGMLSTLGHGLVADDGHGRLLQLLDEVYELRNDHVVVSIVDREPFQLFVGDHVGADGSIRLAEDLVVMPGGTVETADGSGDGLISWRGGHVVDDRRMELFRIDGRAAILRFEDVMANPRPSSAN